MPESPKAKYKLVAQDVCRKSGHNIASLDVGRPIIEPASKAVLYEKITICTRCGLTLEDIWNYRAPSVPPSKRNQENEANGNSGE